MDEDERPPVSLEQDTMQRLRQIVRVLIRHGFLDVVQRLQLLSYLPLSSRLLSEKFREEANLPPEVRLRLVLIELGPTFIKLGQFLSSRPDIFPSEFIKELEKLTDNVPPFPFEEVKKQVRKGIGRPLGKVFSTIESTPLGTASIGQVHKARLLSGKTVVIKVKRPGVEKIIKEDIRLMTFLASLSERYFPNESAVYTPTEIVRQFSRTVNRELDYRREGRNVERIRRLFADDPGIYIPKTHLEYTTKDVLVQDFVAGIKMSKISRKKVGKETIRKISLAYLRQVIEFGVFQADPHLGNIFLRKDGTIGIIDFGAVGTLDEDMKEKVGQWFHALIKNDVPEMANLLYEMGTKTPKTNMKFLKEDTAEFVQDYQELTAEELEIRKFYSDFTNIARRNHVKMPVGFLHLLRMTATIEGLLKRFDPGFQLRVMGPYIEKQALENTRPDRMLAKTSTRIAEINRFVNFVSPFLTSILERTSEGEMRFELGHGNLEREVSKLDSAVNKVALSAIVSSLIIGSSLVLVSDKGPMLYDYSAVGVAGMAIAAFLGSIAIIRIFSSR